MGKGCSSEIFFDFISRLQCFWKSLLLNTRKLSELLIEVGSNNYGVYVELAEQPGAAVDYGNSDIRKLKEKKEYCA